MNSERIKAIAKMVNQDDIVLDVGCDHGYLGMYLLKNNLCSKVYASDISNNALDVAKKNYQKYHLDIPCYLSDGLNNIDVSFNTLVISGMGTSTILKILDNPKIPNKLILGSNNDYYKLRKGIYKLGYYIKEEVVILENKHYYVIITAIKDNKKVSYKELLFGKSHNKEYYQYLYHKNQDIIKKVPLLKKLKLISENKLLKGLIEKK